MGATDLIASGDWTAPWEGVIFFFRTMMLVPISMPADLLGSYSKARFSIFFSVLGPRLHLHSGLPGFEKARDGWDNGHSDSPTLSRQVGNVRIRVTDAQIRLAVGRNTHTQGFGNGGVRPGRSA